MDIPELTAFLVVAQEGSFSKAASLLKMSQPAVSRRIQSLESTLEQKLFYRDGQSITLTPVGIQLLPRANEILKIIKTTLAEIEGLSEIVQGSLKLAVSHHFAEYYLGTLLSKFTNIYSNVQLSFQFVASEEACQLVENGQADLGLGTLPLTTPDKLSCLPILTEQLFIAVSRNHELHAKKTITKEQLCNTQAILPPMSGFTGKKIQAAFNLRGVKPTKKIECNAFASLRSLLQAQLGWGVLPSPLIDRTMSELRCVPNIEIDRQIGIIYHRNRTPTAATKALLNLNITDLYT